MGIFRETLDSYEFNVRERTYIYGGILAGAVFPIVLGRVACGGTRDWKEELTAWGISILVNSLPLGGLRPYTPAPYISSMAGLVAGGLLASFSRIKRRGNLDNIN